MLKRVNYVVNNQFKAFEVPRNKVIQLKGDKVSADTFISVIERSIASDFSQYYNEFDEKEGIKYLGDIQQASVEFDFGTLSFINNVALKKLTTRRNFYGIRYIGSDNIRSFMSPISSEDIPDDFGVSLLKYSSALSKSSWIRLEKLYNDMCEFKSVRINTSKREIEFNFEGNEEWSTEALQLAYLLLSESFISAHRGIRVLLLSEITCMTDAQISRLINALCSVSNLECIIFRNDISAECASNIKDLGVLDV